MASNRKGRINEELQRELSALIRTLKDPRVQQSMVSVTKLEATGDLRYAKVYVSFLQEEKAEGAIIQACKEKGLNTTVELGEAAFYGPKLDFMVKDALGRSWQLGTIQVDYNLPERFDLTYKGSDDKLHRPIMIHRAPFGSMERFVAVLLEHTGGKFPLWLTPDQCVVLPISEKYNEYAEKVVKELNKVDIRTQIDDRNEKIGRKIRDNELKRIPYLLIVGEKEAEDGKVSVRAQGEGDKGQMTIAQFAEFMKELVAKEIEANK